MTPEEKNKYYRIKSARRALDCKAKGICTTCKTRKAKEGYVSCKICCLRGTRKISKSEREDLIRSANEKIRIGIAKGL